MANCPNLGLMQGTSGLLGQLAPLTGDRVRVTLRLSRTAAQQRTVILRQEPSDAPNSRRLRHDLAKIGC